MKIVNLTDTLAVTGQISVQDVAEIAAAGFRVLVNNRPDGEAQDQPGSEEIAIAARDLGLRYVYLPVTAGNFPGPDVADIAAIMSDEHEPVLAFCRTGTRCTNLWVATRPAPERQEAEIQAKQLGYDLSMSSAR